MGQVRNEIYSCGTRNDVTCRGDHGRLPAFPGFSEKTDRKTERNFHKPLAKHEKI
jgi:hypothetical protein